MKRRINVPAEINYQDDGSVTIALQGQFLNPQFRIDINLSNLGTWTWELFSHDDRLNSSGDFSGDDLADVISKLGIIWDKSHE